MKFSEIGAAVSGVKSSTIPSLMLHMFTNIQPQSFVGSTEDLVIVFTIYWHDGHLKNTRNLLLSSAN